MINTPIQYKSQKQESKCANAKVIFRRLNIEITKIYQEDGEIVVRGEHTLFGCHELVIKPRGGWEWVKVSPEIKKQTKIPVWK